MKTSVSALLDGVSLDIGRSISDATLDAADPARQCTEAFLGPRYGNMLAGAAVDRLKKEFEIDPAKARAKVAGNTGVLQNSEGVAGIALVVLRRQLGALANRIGQRIAGAVLGRLVSVFAGGVGLVLLGKDILDSADGVLPVVAREMKSKATKDLVQAELAKAIGDQMGERSREIATATADSVIATLREFRRSHAKVLELAERHEPLRRFLDGLDGRGPAAPRRGRRPRSCPPKARTAYLNRLQQRHAWPRP